MRINLKNLRKKKKKKFIVLDIPLLIENKIIQKIRYINYLLKHQKKIIIKRLKQRGNYNKKIFDILKPNN